MLTSFTIERTFNRLTVKIFVYAKGRDASAIVTYDGLIVWDSALTYEEVRTPELAEAWLSRPTAHHASLVEQLEWEYRTGIRKVEPPRAA